MQFGAYTFVETRRDPATGEPVDVDKSFADVWSRSNWPIASASMCSGSVNITGRITPCRRRRLRWLQPPLAPSAFD